jgi:hypothetical protein
MAFDDEERAFIERVASRPPGEPTPVVHRLFKPGGGAEGTLRHGQ